MAAKSRAKPQDDDPSIISEHEVQDIEDRARPRARVIYEIVRQEGSADMQRPRTSLVWSGLAAGLSISFSLLAQAILFRHLPTRHGAPWSRISATASAS